MRLTSCMIIESWNILLSKSTSVLENQDEHKECINPTSSIVSNALHFNSVLTVNGETNLEGENIFWLVMVYNLGDFLLEKNVWTVKL
jgi:hypothetical protein